MSLTLRPFFITLVAAADNVNHDPIYQN
jgi:hypothetical protein